MSDTDALSLILAQTKLAKAELDAYAPLNLGWYDRAVKTVQTLVPWLVREAPGLRVFVEETLNSPRLLREAWNTIKSQIDAPAEVARIDELLNREAILLDFVAGDTVSIVITRHLLAAYPSGALAANSKSDYPDLYIKTNDYSKLPVRARDNQDFGAAVRGKLRKPIRVPDGLEIKTSRDGANIDCHHAHVGLHLVLSFVTKGERIVVDDVLAAFLRDSDYRKTVPKTKSAYQNPCWSTFQQTKPQPMDRKASWMRSLRS